MTIKQLIAVCMVSGCAVGSELDSLDEVDVSETTLAISDWMYTWHSANWDQGYELDLGSSTDKTCFLVGIKGSLKGWSSYSNTNYRTASAEVVNVNGRYKVRTAFGYGPGVAAKVGCVLGTANRTTFGASWYGHNDMTTNYVPVTPNRRCFITSIRGRGHGFTARVVEQPNSPPGVGIISDGINFRFAGNVIDHADDSLTATAGAVCVDMPDGAVQTWTLEGPVDRALSIGAYTCGFSAISGVFTDSISSRGLELYKAGSDTWRANLGEDYEGRANCAH